jgi:hypothetical protein
MKRTFVLRSAQVVANAIATIRCAPLGYRVTIDEPKRTLEQNDALHPLVRAIARQVKFADEWQSEDDWRRILLSGFLTATGHKVQVLRGIEGESVIIRISTRKLDKSKFSEFLEYVNAWAAERGVKLQEDNAA